MGQWYYGNASYFDPCPVGDDCCRGYYDIGYGYLWTDQSCGILPQRGCVGIGINDRCTGYGIWLPISTQCSCAGEGSCSMTTYCNGVKEGKSTPILDLTTDLFLYCHQDLDDGRVRFKLYT